MFSFVLKKNARVRVQQLACRECEDIPGRMCSSHGKVTKSDCYLPLFCFVCVFCFVFNYRGEITFV